MKRVGLIATIVIAAMLIAGCGNSNNIDNKTTVNESLAVSSSVGNTENNNSEIVKEIKVVQRLLKQSQQLLKLPHEKKQLQFKR